MIEHPAPLVSTDYGFTWGPLTVERTATMPSGSHVITVTSVAGKKVDIYVSPGGRSVRVFNGAQELTACHTSPLAPGRLCPECGTYNPEEG